MLYGDFCGEHREPNGTPSFIPLSHIPNRAHTHPNLPHKHLLRSSAGTTPHHIHMEVRVLLPSGDEHVAIVHEDDTVHSFRARLESAHPTDRFAALQVKGTCLAEGTALCDVDLCAGDTVEVVVVAGREVVRTQSPRGLTKQLKIVTMAHAGGGCEVYASFIRKEHLLPGFNFHLMHVDVGGVALTLDLWALPRAHGSTIKAILQDVGVLICTYAVTSVESLAQIEALMVAARAQPCVAVLVGDNMHSPARMLSRAAGAEAAERHGMLHIEVDSGTGQFIDEAFLMVWHQRLLLLRPFVSLTSTIFR